MKRVSIRPSKQNKIRPTENLYQSSRSRYLHAFAAARAMRFWRPRITAKELSVAAVFAAVLAMGPSSAQAQFGASFDLSTLDGTNGFVINGIEIRDRSGGSVSGAGDVNGDGIDDVVIGANWADPNGNNLAGESYVVFGNNSGVSASFDLSALNGVNGFKLNGINANDRSGGRVSDAGDINGDGLDDLIIGSGADESYVVFGNNSGFSPSLDLDTLNGSNGFVIESDGAISGAGDVNGDGIDDLIIGAAVVFGSNNGFSSSLDLSTLDGINGFLINGGDPTDLIGGSVSEAGDVNGDGIDDLIIGASAPRDGYLSGGISYVVFGNNTGFSSSLDLSTLDGSNGFVIDGVDMAELFRAGSSVSGAGDINGDGIDDLIIGARRGSPNGTYSAGRSYVVFGNNTGFSSSLDLSTLDGTNGFVVNGIDTEDYSGTSVSAAGDVNGDGFDDLIIGANGAGDANGSPYAGFNGNSLAGESYVVFGNNTGFSSSLDLNTLDGTNGFVLNGVDFYDCSGGSVSGAGDVNGDGLDDLIIGADGGDPNVNASAGESYVVFGRASVPNPLIGDVNQDGVINFLDIGPFISLLASNDYLEEADINVDEVVDFLDIQPFIDVLSSQQ